MYARLGTILLIFMVLSCTNEFFPEGLYDYQVERLLSGGSNKTWNQQVNSSDCQDSLRLRIELVASADDSVLISEIIGGSSCAPDTTPIGLADASSFLGGLRFTDSLNFADGTSWIVNEVTSNTLIITTSIGPAIYTAD